MHPLVRLGPLILSTYALFHMAGYAAGLGLAVTLGRHDGRRTRDLLDGSLVFVASGLLGAKLFHTLLEADGHVLGGVVVHSAVELLRADPWHWARITEPGFVFYGGCVLVVVNMLAFARLRRLDRIGAGFDCTAPGMALGMIIGRAGCFLAGCCHGTPTTWPTAVIFPEGHPSAGVPVHPVQLYEAAFWAVALLYVPLAWRQRRFPGEVFIAVALAYTVARPLLELVRGDAERGTWFGGRVSTSQVLSLLLFPVLVGVRWWMLRRAQRTSETPASPGGHFSPGRAQ
ncbi:MAG: prolipoprotein diacylglyceryl transferase [Deltaproteobacteria bacterium]|nr:prolipoprotein diacylglyceryl transferase [Deltaproteobacteria bacterium]